jgi:hypothetical protein
VGLSFKKANASGSKKKARREEMGEMKHADGPWSVVPYGDGDSLVIHSDDANRVCFMATHGGSRASWERIQANAALIAAAPDLYEALNAIAEFAPDQNCGKDPYVQIAAFAKSTARAALSRALETGGGQAVIFDKVTRFEVIDHVTGDGRIMTKRLEPDATLELSLQDDGRTLKVFLRSNRSATAQAAHIRSASEEARTFVEFVLRHTLPERATAHGAEEVYSIIAHHPFAQSYGPSKAEAE